MAVSQGNWWHLVADRLTGPARTPPRYLNWPMMGPPKVRTHGPWWDLAANAPRNALIIGRWSLNGVVHIVKLCQIMAYLDSHWKVTTQTYHKPLLPFALVLGKGRLHTGFETSASSKLIWLLSANRIWQAIKLWFRAAWKPTVHRRRSGQTASNGFEQIAQSIHFQHEQDRCQYASGILSSSTEFQGRILLSHRF